MDIDSGSFDAKRYVLSMLKQNSIKELMRRNNEIDEEIKIHDHEIQSLVFENYSKFISSIDTVRQMKDNICQVDDKLKVLETSMDNISRLALKIDSTFAVKRKEIQKLDTINKDLEKLKNLCEFPNVLAQDIKHYKLVAENNRLPTEVDQCFAKSILFYEQCYATLLDLREEPLIAPIYREAVDKVETIRSTLKAAQAQFNKNKSHSAVLRSITRKLLIITDDQVSVLRIYFHSWKERFGEACFKSERRPHTLPTADNGKRVLEPATEIPEINEELWKEFDAEFKFIYEEAYPKLRLTAE
jgi:vacuolar protein sorting-associated protein 51